MYVPNYLQVFIFTFVVLTLIMSFIYFYISTHGGRDPFIKFWGLCWLFYSLSLFALALYLNSPSIYYISFRKIFDMFNLFFLLKGAYSFARIMIPSYWNRFSIYMILWVLMGAFYNLDIMAISLPVSAFQIVLTLTLCFVVFKYWDVTKSEKVFAICVFLVWGMGKSTLSIIEIGSSSTSYLVEIVLSNILNFSIFIIYLQRIYNHMKIGDHLFKIIAENATDVIFLYSLKPKQEFQYITPSIEAMTGYSPYDFYSDPSFYMQIVAPAFYEKISSIFNGDNITKQPLSKTFEIIHKNGSNLWVQVNVSSIFDKGVPIAIEGFIRDITTMKEAQSNLISSRKSRERLLSYVSHELKTPLTSVLGYVNALKDGTIKNKHEVENAIDIIFSKTQTLRRLIDDLMQLSKLETKQFSFNFAYVQASDLVKQLVNEQSMDIKSANVDVTYKINYKVLKDKLLIADTERIIQVYSNIITNSLKYTKENGKIIVKIGSRRRQLFVSVWDNGTGIDPKDMPYIFDRFYKDPTRANKSTGLGLTISKEIIDAHKGKIIAKSELNKGCTFIFYIPFCNKGEK